MYLSFIFGLFVSFPSSFTFDDIKIHDLLSLCFTFYFVLYDAVYEGDDDAQKKGENNAGTKSTYQNSWKVVE